MAATEQLSQDTLFDLLSNTRRRFVLHYLLGRDEPVSIQELSRQTAAWELETPPEDLSSQEVKRVYVALYQTHVPKLEDAGVVEYDGDTGRVRLLSRARQCEPYLETATESQRPWYLYYGGLAVLSALFYLAVIGDIPGVSTINSFTAGIIVLAGFLGLTIVHVQSARRRV